MCCILFCLKCLDFAYFIFIFFFHFSVIDETPLFDFVFLFTCREINILLDNVKTAEELLRHKYPEVFDIISLSDLESISDRVLIVVDGLDELQNIYDIHDMNKRSLNFELVSSLIDTKKGIFKNNKVIVCGRPRACELVKQQFKHKSKTIEVCGFNEDNIMKYIDQFFNQREVNARKVKEALRISSNLKVMATVPVFLWVICSVYGQELVTKPLNTYTELYTYASLIFLRNHFRGKAQQNSMSLFDVLENDEIMNSVFALMALSVQTYMQNKVLFTEDDIKLLICPTQLEKTGFILRYNRGNLRKPVYQFKHLVLQEYFCGLSLCVTKWVSPYLSNRELSSCAPVIFGINRLLKEGQNELFISFFKKLSEINILKMRFVTKYILMPYRHLIFRKYLSRNNLEIPDCMIRDDVLLINASLPECQEFMILLFESRFKLECPFTSSKIVGDFSETDYRNALYLLKAMKLKLKIPDEMIDGNTIVIDNNSSTFTRFVKDGVEMTRHSFTHCEIVENLSETDYSNALFLLKTLKLKLKIPDNMIDGDTIVIDNNSSTFTRFVKDGVEMDRHSFTHCEIVENLSETDYRNALFLLKTLKLKLKIPDNMIDGDTIVIDNNSSTFTRFVKDGFEMTRHSFTHCEIVENLSETDYRNALFLLKTLKLKLKIPDSMIYGDLIVIDNNSSTFTRFVKDGVEIDKHSLTRCEIVENLSETDYRNTLFLLKTLKLKLKIPDSMIDGDTMVIEGNISTIIRFVIDGVEIDKHSLTRCEIFGKLSETDYRNALFLLKTLKFKLKIPDRMIDGDSIFIYKNMPTFTIFVKDGIEIDKHPFTHCEIVENLSETDYRNTLFLLKTLNLKLKIPDEMINGDTIVIDNNSSTFTRFVKDGVEMTRHSFTHCEIVGNLSETDYRNALFLLKTLKLKLKIPDFMINGDTMVIDNNSSTFTRFVNDGVEIDKHSLTRCKIVDKLSETDYSNALFLVKKLKLNKYYDHHIRLKRLREYSEHLALAEQASEIVDSFY